MSLVACRNEPTAARPEPPVSSAPASASQSSTVCPDGKPPIVAAPCLGKDVMEALHCPGRRCVGGTVWDGTKCVPPCGDAK